LPAEEQRLKLVVLAQVAVKDRVAIEVEVVVTVLVP
jgi:hypothetical protein